jgi:hypothetical protein
MVSAQLAWIGFATIGGILFSFGNLSVYRAPLTKIAAIQASLCVGIGTTINALSEPSKTPCPVWLVIDVALF